MVAEPPEFHQGVRPRRTPLEMQSGLSKADRGYKPDRDYNVGVITYWLAESRHLQSLSIWSSPWPPVVSVTSSSSPRASWTVGLSRSSH